MWCNKTDYCLNNGICYYEHSPDAGSLSRCIFALSNLVNLFVFLSIGNLVDVNRPDYLGGCTDQTLSNTTVCNNYCTDEGLPDVVWNSTAEAWMCCSCESRQPTGDDWTFDENDIF